MNRTQVFAGLGRATWLLCLGVVILGAFVRLSDAGLGCPDWPGCYGHIGAPPDIEAANAAFPERPVEVDKAWKEMIHRYFASGVGLGILLLMVVGWRERLAPRGFLLGMFALVCFQGTLGMWTVTWQLKPLAVSAHLLGGMATLAMLTWLNVRYVARGAASASATLPTAAENKRVRTWLRLAAVMLVIQIFLGGWTSSNYAALACPDLPTCHGEWWPDADFGEAFVLWRGLGQNYEFGVLDSPARTAIHLTHRIGAIVLTGIFIGLIWVLWSARLRAWAVAVAGALALQLSIGISIVVLALPLWLATAHNAGAALLVMLLTALAAWRQRVGHA